MLEKVLEVGSSHWHCKVSTAKETAPSPGSPTVSAPAPELGQGRRGQSKPAWLQPPGSSPKGRRRKVAGGSLSGSSRHLRRESFPHGPQCPRRPSLGSVPTTPRPPPHTRRLRPGGDPRGFSAFSWHFLATRRAVPGRSFGARVGCTVNWLPPLRPPGVYLRTEQGDEVAGDERRTEERSEPCACTPVSAFVRSRLREAKSGTRGNGRRREANGQRRAHS